MQTIVAFSFPVWNGLLMPRRKVALSGILAFGAGVAVGANWPRAGNMVGYLLQRLGFELTDLTLWIWDPEKSVIQEAKSKRITAKKKAQTPLLPENDPLQTNRRARAKTRSRRIHSKTETLKATRETRADVLDPWILNSRLNRSPKNANRVSRLKSSGKSNSDIETAHRARKKTNGMTVKSALGRKSRNGQDGRKAKVFAGKVSPVSAALN
jgi:hypothetical protein